MKILVTGKDGQLGRAFQKELDGLSQNLGINVIVRFIGRQDCDLSNLSALDLILKNFQPHVIINTAAYTAVDKAEQEIDFAFVINSAVPQLLARYAAAHGATLLHYSTDYVFDGSGSCSYSEDHPANPLGIYGKSKAEGEQLIANEFSKERVPSARYAILRTSWVYGDGGNFIRTILRLAYERSELKVIADQFGVPTSAQWLAHLSSEFLFDLSVDGLVSIREFQSGIYHAVPSGETTWYGLACEVVRVARELGKSLVLSPEGIVPIPAVEYPLPAPRPMNSRFSTAKLAAEFERLGLMSKLVNSANGLNQSWDQGVRAYINE